MKYSVIAFYHFHALEDALLESYKQRLTDEANRLSVRGLMILGVEGVNSTLCGEDAQLQEFFAFMKSALGLGDFPVKESRAEHQAFRRFKVKIREEIVTTRDASLDPKHGAGTHLSPEEWHRMMQEEDVVVMDTRNWYETKIGKFRGAVDPNLTQFHEFAQYLPQSGVEKDKKVLIYCTGGIRCEKAIVEMNRQGFKNVFQLDGGILNYLKHYPQGEFEGECFVFDHRVAVDHNLQPSQRYSLCPHCGQPGELQIECQQCGEAGVICENCAPTADRQTCSKNCAHHYRMGHRSRRKQKQSSPTQQP